MSTSSVEDYSAKLAFYKRRFWFALLDLWLSMMKFRRGAMGFWFLGIDRL
jgi:hypothetical protein